MGLSFPVYEMAKLGYSLVSASAPFSRMSAMSDSQTRPIPALSHSAVASYMGILNTEELNVLFYLIFINLNGPAWPVAPV